MKRLRFFFTGLIIFLFHYSVGFGQAEPVEIVIHTDQGKSQISKFIYGHFSEHLGRCIYGGFYVGEDNKLIPTIGGVRKDVIEALKEMKIPVLRWPGGCFADTYHWKEGIGPKSERPSVVNQWWGGVTEDNSFGTHDFLNLCEEIGADPYLAANVGSGTVKEFTDWVQYTTHDDISPMAELRKENGREKPWKVKFWGIGNEVWGCGGNMTPEYYANIYKQYSTFMVNWRNDEGFYRIASGASDDNYHWTEVLMRDIPTNLIEGVALHSYSVIDWSKKGSATDFDESQYFATMQSALRMEELVVKHSAIMDKYDPEKKVGLVVDEWGGWYNVEEGTNPSFLYQQNTMRDAMIAGATLNIFNNHCERVKMANLAQTINVLQAVILTDEEKMLLTPTYYVMKMYAVHQDATLLPVQFDNINYVHNNKTLPAISISASINSEGVVHVSLVNIDYENSHSVVLNLNGFDFKNIVGSILTSNKMQDHNTFEKPNYVIAREFNGAKANKGKVNISLPPFSVVVLELR